VPIGVSVAYLAASLLFIVGIRRMRSPETARIGNITSALGMLIAVVATLFQTEIGSLWQIALGVAVGSVIGAVAAQRVKMTAMPQMVAAFNGVGGGAAALVALVDFYRVQALGAPEEGFVATLAILLGILIGSVSFAGSVVAFGKLQEIFLTGSVSFPGQKAVNALIALGVVVLGVLVLSGSTVISPLLAVTIIMAASLVLGVLLVIPIGGADMPIVISLLNAFTGLAAAMSGFVLSNDVLIISGSLVGASGTILTRLMSSSLGRPLGGIIFAAAAAGGDQEEDDGEEKSVHSVGADDVATYLDYEADSIVFVPGYGLAVAQAQSAMADLMKALEAKGKTVRFAIHPVAGRMPGHMNVLLAEADVPYDKLVDMEDINDDFDETDAVVIVGANDVVNPMAREEGSSAISGMPILDVDHARQVIFVKRSLSPGFAGVDNPLFYDEEKTMMLFSDAKDGLEEVASVVKSS
jgi:proton-translocating NAD(P)+ transhydrogenase subunit beta